MTTAAARVYARSTPTGDCLVWTGAACTQGYGQMSVDNRMQMVHRITYEAAHGPIPDGLVIDHLCHNPAICTQGKCSHRLCVNPAHLTAVPHVENAKRQYPAFKTHCKNGHPLSGDNLRIRPDGRRRCHTCARESYKRHMSRKAAA